MDGMAMVHRGPLVESPIGAERLIMELILIIVLLLVLCGGWFGWGGPPGPGWYGNPAGALVSLLVLVLVVWLLVGLLGGVSVLHH